MDKSMLVNEGYWLDRVDNGDSRSLDAAMSRAVFADHTCEDYAGCDIARARGEGYTYVAAHLLMGATETPTIDTLTHTLFPGAFDGLLRREGGWPAGWDEWTEFHRTYGIECEACGHYMYRGRDWTPEQCSNCLAALPDPTPAVVD